MILDSVVKITKMYVGTRIYVWIITSNRKENLVLESSHSFYFKESRKYD